ncbi:hypothetical protein BSUW23_06140 [Bacillus spizizenii str. W23]|uniref:Uncharacterized protein n=1 Tax=Bacillus spizizenii (strain ATCC 23059 / NRRL B-14472 / W23) TaxID=655816 RepID=E0U0D5_BACSH|nr:hypothetical protein BSUW23_06140 [Bacillus spizizenii str. W23]AJW86658.1 hypothetical protein BIS30_16760 [Bacillus spizizenii]EFG91439.1 hypothetical protein BSU6633_16087 [Bacillus spizizenii ATCC 6633 = JCM 2499]KFI04348.1 hypothetical protein JN25_03040 [Bacillus sp. BSC154]
MFGKTASNRNVTIKNTTMQIKNRTISLKIQLSAIRIPSVSRRVAHIEKIMNMFFKVSLFMKYHRFLEMITEMQNK